MQCSATPKKKGKHMDTSKNSKNLNTTHKNLTLASLPHNGDISFVVDSLTAKKITVIKTVPESLYHFVRIKAISESLCIRYVTTQEKTLATFALYLKRTSHN